MDGIDNLVDSQFCFRFFILFFVYFFNFSGPGMLGFALGGVGSGRGGRVSGACLGHVSFVATSEASSFLHHSSLFFLSEGVVDPAQRVNYHGDHPTASFTMGLSLGFEGATPFAFSLSKPRLFLFLWVDVTVLALCHASLPTIVPL